jgi:alanyl-tRNA synthetase
VAGVQDINDPEKCAIAVMIGDQLVKQGLNANTLVKNAAKLINGGGGGQPHFATAGGKNTAGLQDAIDHILDNAGIK